MKCKSDEGEEEGRSCWVLEKSLYELGPPKNSGSRRSQPKLLVSGLALMGPAKTQFHMKRTPFFTPRVLRGSFSLQLNCGRTAKWADLEIQFVRRWAPTKWSTEVFKYAFRDVKVEGYGCLHTDLSLWNKGLELQIMALRQLLHGTVIRVDIKQHSLLHLQTEAAC